MLVQSHKSVQIDAAGSKVQNRLSVTPSTPPQSSRKGCASSVLETLDAESAGPILLCTPGSGSTTVSTGCDATLWSRFKSPATSSPTASRESAPITPPTSPTRTGHFKASVQPKTDGSPLLRKGKGSNIANTLGTCIAEASKALGEEVTHAALDLEDQLQPKKLFCNLTDALNQVAEACNHGNQKFSLTPEIDFSFQPVAADAKRSTFTARVVLPKVSRASGPPRTSLDIKSTQPTCQIEVKAERTSASSVAPPREYHTKPSEAFQKDLEHILPHDLRGRLEQKPKICVGSVVRNPRERCTYKIKTDPVHGRPAEDAVSRLDGDHTLEDFLKRVEVVVYSTMCRIHQNSAFGKRMEKLEALLESPLKSSSADRAAFYTWAEAIADVTFQESYATPSSIDRTVDDESVRGNTSGARRQTSPPTTATARQAISTVSGTSREAPIRFQPYQPKTTKSLSPDEALYEVINKDLTATDVKSGFIYIFWYKGQFGLVKIGRSNDPKRRLSDWNKQCKRTHDFHISSYNGDLVEVPHVSRVERLMHTELKDQRRTMKCDGCGKIHREWFDVSEKQAVAVFEKWRDWMAQEPYQKDKHTGEWKLKRSMQGGLEEVCRPVQVEPTHRYSLRSRNSSGKVGQRRGRRTAT